MKKIFAISFLSVFAVVGVARANYSGYYASGTPADENYNLASVSYVKGRYDSAVQTAKGLVVKSDKKTTVGGSTTFSGYAGSDYVAPTIKYMENSIAEAVADIDLSTKVDKTSVISSTGTVTSDDTQIPTVKRMESEIEDALGWVEDTVVAIDQGVEKKEQILVTDSVGAVITVPQIGMEQVADLEGVLNSKVANEQIVATPGGNSMGDYAASLQAGAEADADMVSAVPSVNAVAESFVPNEAVDYYNGAMWGNSQTMQEPGAYLLMVIVDENGNKSYRWVATQIDLYDTSAGQIAG